MNNIVPRSIAFNYPGYQSLPRGIKKMLVFTESFFFGAENTRAISAGGPLSGRLQPPAGIERTFRSFGASWTN